MLLINKYESNLIVHGFPSPLQLGGGGTAGGDKKFSYNYTTLSLFQFFRNSQHPEK